jgi:uncharacterized protein (TIGR00251 family)
VTGFWRAEAGGVTLRVKVQPGARRAGILGLAEGADGPRLRLAVTERPTDGRANRAVREAVADWLGVPPSAVSLVQGAAAREKLLRIEGDADRLAPRLAALT